MKKIKIKSKGFPTTHYGDLKPNQEIDVSDQFASYCVERMKAAEYVSQPKGRRVEKQQNTKEG
jgi:hypothetical protein